MKYLGENSVKKLIALIKGDLTTKQPTITASGILKGDGAGTVTAADTQEATLVDVPNGLLKGDGTTITAAVAGTDYFSIPTNTGTAGQVLTKTTAGHEWQDIQSGSGLVLNSIKISTPASKTNYKAGETFNSAGMIVKADYSNGEDGPVIISDITITGWSVIPSTALSVNNTYITVQYTEGGVTKTVNQSISVTRTALPIPSQKGTLTYNGNSQSPTWNNYDSTKMTLGGTTSSTNAGNFTATFTIKDTDLYCWSDNSTTAKSVTWSIGKMAGTLTLSKSTSTLKPGTLTDSFTITTNSTGTISISNDNTSIVTATRSGTTVTLTSIDNKTGTANIIISVAADTNHTAPANATCVVNCKFVTTYGVSWDGTSSTTLSRTDAAASFTNPVAYMSGISNYGSPFDSLMPWSGMVRSTRSCGEVVSIPKFWYKLTQNGAGVNIQIADGAVDGFSVCPACMDRGDGKGERDVVYVGRYHCATSTYKSTSGVKPAANATRSAFRTSIHNLGSTVWQMDFATRFTIWLLYIVEYANWNSQAVIGYGCGNNSSTVNMGYTDSMPYHTGTTLTSRTSYGSSTQYRYIEGLWDNVLDWIDGAYNNSSGLNIILKPNNFSDSANGISVGTPTNGWIGGFAVKNVSGTYPLLISSSTSGSGSTYVCDYWYFYSSVPCLRVGGSYYQYLYYGLFYVGCNSASSSSSDVGSRLLDLGT